MTARSDFIAELDRWQDAGRKAEFWWRDDDATAATPALERLMALRAAFDVPIAIAAIPEAADATLAAALRGADSVCVLQHGFAHRNHAPDGVAKIELGGGRRVENVRTDLAHGRDLLAGLFGELLLPVMVPPWNRIDPGIVALLPALGYRGLSTFAARRDTAAAGFATVNTHIDIIDWPGSRRFCGEEAALATAIRHLAAKRAGHADADEPTGLLTHHLAHDDECWHFIHGFLEQTAVHPAAEWVAAREAFGMTP